MPRRRTGEKHRWASRTAKHGNYLSNKFGGSVAAATATAAAMAAGAADGGEDPDNNLNDDDDDFPLLLAPADPLFPGHPRHTLILLRSSGDQDHNKEEILKNATLICNAISGGILGSASCGRVLHIAHRNAVKASTALPTNGGRAKDAELDKALGEIPNGADVFVLIISPEGASSDTPSVQQLLAKLAGRSSSIQLFIWNAVQRPYPRENEAAARFSSLMLPIRQGKLGFGASVDVADLIKERPCSAMALAWSKLLIAINIGKEEVNGHLWGTMKRQTPTGVMIRAMQEELLRL